MRIDLKALDADNSGWEESTFIHWLAILLNENSPPTVLARLCQLQQEQWEQLYELATRHGVAPMVARNVHHWKRSLGPRHTAIFDAIPAPIQSQLNHIYLVSEFGHEKRLAQLSRILTKLRSANIDVILLKGSFLSSTVYASGAERTMSDIDLLIPKGDLLRARDLLLNDGYTANNSGSISYQHLPPLTRKDQLAIELHWALVTTDSAVTIDIKQVWQRAVPVAIAGVNISALCPEDLLLHLILHSALQHRFNMGLRPLCDILATLRYYQGKIDWQQIQQRAHAWKATNSLHLMLHVIHQLFDVDTLTLPHNLLAINPPSPKLIALAMEQIIEVPMESTTVTRQLTKTTTGTLLEKLRGFRNALFLPKDLLAQLYHLDPQSKRLYLYYFVRLRYLLRQHGSTLRHLLQRGSPLNRIAEREKTLLNWMEQ